MKRNNKLRNLYGIHFAKKYGDKALIVCGLLSLFFIYLILHRL